MVPRVGWFYVGPAGLPLLSLLFRLKSVSGDNISWLSCSWSLKTLPALRVNNPSLLRLTPDRWWRSTRFHPLWNDRSPPWRSSARRNALLPGPEWASLHGYETVQETNYDSDKTDVIFDGVLIDTLRSIFDWHNITVQYHATSIGGCKCKTVLFGTCHRMSQAWQDESGGT